MSNMRTTQRRSTRAIALVASSLLMIDAENQARSFSIKPTMPSLKSKKRGLRKSESPPRVLSDDSIGNSLHAETTFSTLEPAYVKPLHSQGQLTPSYPLSLTPATTIGGERNHPSRSRLLSTHSKKPVDRLLPTIFSIYLCSMFALSIPSVVLVPVIAVDPASHALGMSSVPDMAASAAFVARMVGLGTLGGAFGKAINGFICQALGGRNAARIYFICLAISSLLLSQCQQTFHGAALFSLEFFSSISWTACTVMLARAYQHSPERLSEGMKVLALASTLGALLTKAAGIIMLRSLHWRSICQISAVVALCGAAIVHIFIKEHDLTTGTDRLRASIRQRAGLGAARPMQVNDIVSSLKYVGRSRMFWTCGLAHAMGFLARRSDAFLGSFLSAVCDVPANLCGGLTASVTLGFIYGLRSSNTFFSLENEREKARFIKRGYNISAVAALGLALCANTAVSTILGRTVTTAACIGASFCMSSAISFQFYQLPAKCATLFADSKAVCTSFLDGLAFLIGAPIWYGLGLIIAAFGWSAAWTIIAFFLALGGKVMVKAFEMMEKPEL